MVHGKQFGRAMAVAACSGALMLLLLRASEAALAGQQSATAPAPATAASAPAAPAIFTVGLTDIADTSARLVFTTSVPARATVTVEGPSGSPRMIAETQPAEIHSLTIDALRKGERYTIRIAADCAGVEAKPAVIAFTAASRPCKFDTFSGRTLIGVAHGEGRLDLLTDLGAGVQRVAASWDGVEPRRGQFNEVYLAALARNVRELRAANIEPLVLLGYCVPWAKTCTAGLMTWRNRAFGPPDDVEDWKAYVRRVMTDLKGVARYYEVWNEPDAGYLATGVFVERPNLPGPVILREAFRDNVAYWIGDRYVPLAMAVREVADDVDPGISVIGGSWNRDYNGSRGRICFDHAMQRYIQQYSFHNYVSGPHSFASWENAANTFFTSALDNFKAHGVDMPIAITEWGMGTYDQRPENLPGGAWTRADGQAFLVKSCFYYLGLERVSMLVLHQLGFNDPWSLVSKRSDGNAPDRQPMYSTYRWICRAFNNKPYKCLPVAVDPADSIHAYAVHLTEDNVTYLAVWQGRYDAQEKKAAALDARTCAVQVRGLADGAYTLQELGLDGQSRASLNANAQGDLKVQTTLPATDGQSESPPVVYRIVPDSPVPR